ncbi:helix-turn-helix transcriptional regulator [Fibrella aquatilis]|uniref:PAS domain-containing protein n=1 Tax=Fibrella aquatilis TaxID=2817059 RepID=A0A939G687_9BACT|nr:LuxR C-terminal-related transcriptional regulator [Fibrella aquatilis]MBO0931790.1 PAS domain-containing protein [Fibrella aquatilis]
MKDVFDQQPNTQLIERLFPGWVVHHCFDEGRSHQFISGNGAALFGCPIQELNRKTLSQFNDLVHPDDRESYERLRRKVDDIARITDPHELERYRFVLHYRVRRGAGSYFCLHDEKQLYQNRYGKLEIISLFRDLSADKSFVRVQLETYLVNELGYRKLNTYVPTQAEQSLTSREVEIIDLIKEGLSSKEIAGRLFISINTVRNHRSNLFRKTNARNMVDLLNTAAVSEHLN